uniref:Uncharacterized protein n=1 Tax=Plectus sambesii TaxID=2011161 RepID=A0A914W7M9_9BILA
MSRGRADAGKDAERPGKKRRKARRQRPETLAELTQTVRGTKWRAYFDRRCRQIPTKHRPFSSSHKRAHPGHLIDPRDNQKKPLTALPTLTTAARSIPLEPFATFATSICTRGTDTDAMFYG